MKIYPIIGETQFKILSRVASESLHDYCQKLRREDFKNKILQEVNR